MSGSLSLHGKRTDAQRPPLLSNVNFVQGNTMISKGNQTDAHRCYLEMKEDYRIVSGFKIMFNVSGEHDASRHATHQYETVL